MTMTPTLSVLMPVFNAGRYLRRAVESVLCQTLKDFEFLIIDDGSSDGSLEILQSYAAQDLRIRLLSHENRGLSPTANELLHEASGDLVAPMDNDDVCQPQRLERQLAFLQNNPDVVCVGSSYRIIDEADRLILRQFPVEQDDEKIQKLMLAGHVSLHHPTTMYRRQAAIAVGGYDTRLPIAHDMDLWLRLGEVGKLANMDEPLLDYRIHGKSTSDGLQSVALDEIRKACERAWGRRGITGTVETQTWRPSEARASRHEFFLRHGWWAFRSGERSTAALYAVRALATLPWKPSAWKLLACSMLKKSPEQLSIPSSPPAR
jgi:glycosyltransferase involved in cell wall biosynthesis